MGEDIEEKIYASESPLPKLGSDEKTADYSRRIPSLKCGITYPRASPPIAAAKSVGSQTQLRMWIAEEIRREAKRTKFYGCQFLR
ncbi:MAG: hypothetical protein ACR2NN_16820 [Bryobacteraceae bacterium]